MHGKKLPSPLTATEYTSLSLSCLSTVAYLICIETESRAVGLLIASIITLREPAKVGTTGDVDIGPTEAVLQTIMIQSSLKSFDIGLHLI